MQDALVRLGFVVVVFVLGVGRAEADPPVTPPTFTHPLSITNTFSPFQTGAVKVFTGKDSGEKTVLVDLYLAATRTFMLDAAGVETHVLQETEFADGEISEISQNFFAQADDGTVYYFGETVDKYENGVVTSHEGSWVVGPPAAGDPAGTASASVPGVFMVANPVAGDAFKPEDLLPVVDETVTVKAVGQKANVPARHYTGTIQVVETSQLPDSPPETKWYAPGVGAVKGKTKGEAFALVASTLTPP